MAADYSLITSVLLIDYSISFFYSTIGYIFSLFKHITWLLIFIATLGLGTTVEVAVVEAEVAAAGTGGSEEANAGSSVISFTDGFSSATTCLVAASDFLESEVF